MPLDNVELRVNNQKIDTFLSYTIDSEIYAATSAFSFTLAGWDYRAAVGDRCEIWVNNELELTGIIDSAEKTYSKTERRIILEGRDLIGLAVDSYCTEFVSIKNKSLFQITLQLLGSINYLTGQAIEYSPIAQKRVADRSATQIEPGTKIFDALKDVAISRGCMFYARPDGTIVLGTPSGVGDVRLTVNVTYSDNNSQVVAGSFVEDISGQFSSISVITQAQDTGSFDSASDINSKYDLENDRWDFDFEKTYVEIINDDILTPEQIAKMRLEQQRAGGYIVRYLLPGHSQNGVNWSIDRLVSVHDELLDVNETLLIYKRTFKYSKSEGQTAEIILGPVGVVQ